LLERFLKSWREICHVTLNQTDCGQICGGVQPPSLEGKLSAF
jgi:hypothetical protein